MFQMCYELMLVFPIPLKHEEQEALPTSAIINSLQVVVTAKKSGTL